VQCGEERSGLDGRQRVVEDVRDCVGDVRGRHSSSTGGGAARRERLEQRADGGQRTWGGLYAGLAVRAGGVQVGHRVGLGAGVAGDVRGLRRLGGGKDKLIFYYICGHTKRVYVLPIGRHAGYAEYVQYAQYINNLVPCASSIRSSTE